LNLVILESDKIKLESVLTGFIEESGARLAMLVGKNGMILSRRGDFAGVDVQSLAALTAGSFASTQALASVVGEKEFTGVFHQGKRINIYIALVADFGILVAVFDVATTIAMIRLTARETSKRLEPIIADLIARSK